MARYLDANCKLCRREGAKLFLKGDRCFTEKCAFERRGYPPGQHGQSSRGKLSEYGVQLREKQKVKRIYGVLESQFRGFFQEADRKKGITGENLLVQLEERLDTIAYRLGFGISLSDARQLVRHGHLKVNGRKVNIPSYICAVGDEIELREKSRKSVRVEQALGAAARRGVPDWLEIVEDGFKGRLKRHPQREEIQMPIREQLIVEHYSK